MSLTLHTTLGDLKCELYPAQTPKTCENFLALAAAGTYDGTLFHRNLAGFMVQGGDPTNTGKGGTSVFGGEKFQDEIRSSLKFNTRGVLAMASSAPNTSLSQFFLTYAPLPHLDGKHTIFGRLIDGDDVLDRIEKLPVNAKGKPDNKGAECRIESVTIHANPIAKQARDEAGGR